MSHFSALHKLRGRSLSLDKRESHRNSSLELNIEGQMSKYLLQFFGSFHSIICMQLKAHLEILKQKDIFMVDRSSNVLSNGVFIESKIDIQRYDSGTSSETHELWGFSRNKTLVSFFFYEKTKSFEHKYTASNSI